MNRKVLALSSTIVTVAAISCYKLYKWWKCATSILNVPPVYVCNNVADWRLYEKMFIKRFYDAKFVGLDCEWVTVNERRNPVALLQVATSDGLCVLIRLCKIPSRLLPCSLVDCLVDPAVKKVGVGVLEDAEKLFNDYSLIVRGCLDLRYVVQNHEAFQGKSPGLKVLAEKILNVRLKKCWSLTCSNWEADFLTPNQVAYAAEDALASAQIFSHLACEQKSLQWWSRCQMRLEQFEKFSDIPFKQTFVPPVSPQLKISAKLELKKEDLYKKLQTRNRPLYENCQLQAPDGEPLCSCDKKKAMWYVHKGRGDVIKQKPLTVRLNFEPSGRPILDNTYYIQEKSNCCVVCGETKFFFRKLVVPSEYRKHFPAIMKKNLSHDVLLLCASCHRRSNILDQKLREQLAKECDAPINTNKNSKLKVDSKQNRVKSAARALRKAGNRIPQKYKEELENIVKDHYNIQELSDDVLEKASTLETCRRDTDHVPHGLKVYQHMCKHGGLIQFESRWRKHFLDTMKPKFLPTMWSVDHNHERLAIQVTKKETDFDVSILGLNAELLSKEKCTT